MKKLTIYILLLLIAFNLCACGNEAEKGAKMSPAHSKEENKERYNEETSEDRLAALRRELDADAKNDSQVIDQKERKNNRSEVEQEREIRQTANRDPYAPQKDENKNNGNSQPNTGTANSGAVIRIDQKIGDSQNNPQSKAPQAQDSVYNDQGTSAKDSSNTSSNYSEFSSELPPELSFDFTAYVDAEGNLHAALTNLSDYNMSMGEGLILEKEQDGMWVEQGKLKAAAMSNVCAPGKVHDQTVAASGLPELQAGAKYRVLKEVSMNGVSYLLYCEFLATPSDGPSAKSSSQADDSDEKDSIKRKIEKVGMSAQVDDYGNITVTLNNESDETLYFSEAFTAYTRVDGAWVPSKIEGYNFNETEYELGGGYYHSFQIASVLLPDFEAGSEYLLKKTLRMGESKFTLEAFFTTEGPVVKEENGAELIEESDEEKAENAAETGNNEKPAEKDENSDNRAQDSSAEEKEAKDENDSAKEEQPVINAALAGQRLIISANDKAADLLSKREIFALEQLIDDKWVLINENLIFDEIGRGVYGINLNASGMKEGGEFRLSKYFSNGDHSTSNSFSY